MDVGRSPQAIPGDGRHSSARRSRPARHARASHRLFPGPGLFWRLFARLSTVRRGVDGDGDSSARRRAALERTALGQPRCLDRAVRAAPPVGASRPTGQQRPLRTRRMALQARHAPGAESLLPPSRAGPLQLGGRADHRGHEHTSARIRIGQASLAERGRCGVPSRHDRRAPGVRTAVRRPHRGLPSGGDEHRRGTGLAAASRARRAAEHPRLSDLRHRFLQLQLPQAARATDAPIPSPIRACAARS